MQDFIIHRGHLAKPFLGYFSVPRLVPVDDKEALQVEAESIEFEGASILVEFIVSSIGVAGFVAMAQQYFGDFICSV